MSISNNDGTRRSCLYFNKLYTYNTISGVTSDIVFRIKEHKEKLYPNSFSAKFNINILVYYCSFFTIEEAIAEEKRIKGGSRLKKIKLIEKTNPNWIDLWEEVKEW